MTLRDLNPLARSSPGTAILRGLAQDRDALIMDAFFSVAADANNSRVRKQLLPEFERISAKVSVIVGRTQLGLAD
jgi:hypothetical protein